MRLHLTHPKLTLLIIMLHAPSVKAGTLDGQIYDGSGFEQQGYVDVTVTPASHVLRTSSDGRFTLPGLPPGEYIVTLTQEGRLPEALTVQIREDQPTSVNAHLFKKEPANKPAPRSKDWPWMSVDEWYLKHAVHKARSNAGKLDLIFFGDSITEHWQTTGASIWRAWLKTDHAAAMGIGGDTTQNLLWRLTDNQQLNEVRPAAIILLIGTNNFGISKHRPDEVAEGIKANIELLQSIFPDSQILLLGILPRSYEPDTNVRRLIRQVNSDIADLDKHDQIHFIDLESAFIDKDGHTKTELFQPDQTHLTEDGYRELSIQLESALTSILGPDQARNLFH